MNKLILLLVCLGSFSLLMAQESDNSGQGHPAFPAVASAPPGSRWSLTVNPASTETNGLGEQPALSAQPVKPSPAPLGLEMEIGLNRIQHGIITYTDQHTEDFYIVESQVLQKSSNSAQITNLEAATGDPCDLRASPFPAVNWISPDNYVRTEKIGTATFYKFHQLYHLDFGLPLGTECTAWIDVKTHYPRRVQLGGTLYEFSDVTAFPNDVTLPMTLQEKADQIRAEQRAMQSINHSTR